MRARVLAVMPCGLAPLPDAGADKLPLPMSLGGAALAAKRAPAVNAEAEAKR